MNENKFLIKNEHFEGPLDLLLHLIEKRKLLINDISISKITDEYIEYIKYNDLNNSIKNYSDFIVIASTLLLIKSKSLLPNLELTIEEQGSVKELETRLKIYKVIKDNENNISENFAKNISFMTNGPKNTNIFFSPPKNISINLIINSINDIIRQLPKKDILPKIAVKKIISLEETINKLTERVRQNITTSFKDFSNFSKEAKINIVVSFLAMLELVKQGIVETKQNNHFEDIEIQTTSIHTPNYS